MAGVPTRDEVIDFINRKVTNKFCELCGTNNWAVPQASDGLLIASPILQQGGFSIPPPSIPAAITVCTNCGNIRMHALAIVKP